MFGLPGRRFQPAYAPRGGLPQRPGPDGVSMTRPARLEPKPGLSDITAASDCDCAGTDSAAFFEAVAPACASSPGAPRAK